MFLSLFVIYVASFFLIRDDQDTGKPDNPLGLPAFPYETALVIQDRMFKVDGSLFYPAFPGDPEYEGFIGKNRYSPSNHLPSSFSHCCIRCSFTFMSSVDEGAELPKHLFPNGGPTALAEFFGDVMVVNGEYLGALYCSRVLPTI